MVKFKRALKIVHKKYDSSTNEPIELDKTTAIYVRNIGNLAAQIYKTIRGDNPLFMSETFIQKGTKYQLSNIRNLFTFSNVRSSKYGRSTIVSRANHHGLR